MINEVYKMQQLAGLIKESSLSSVFRYMENKKVPVAMMTAFRGENTIEKNISLNKQLSSTLVGEGYKYFIVDGFWIENKGKSNEKHISEDTLFITGKEGDDGKLFTLIKKLM